MLQTAFMQITADDYMRRISLKGQFLTQNTISKNAKLPNKKPLKLIPSTLMTSMYTGNRQHHRQQANYTRSAMTSSFVLFWFPDIVTESNLDGILNKKKRGQETRKDIILSLKPTVAFLAYCRYYVVTLKMQRCTSI